MGAIRVALSGIAQLRSWSPAGRVVSFPRVCSSLNDAAAKEQDKSTTQVHSSETDEHKESNSARHDLNAEEDEDGGHKNPKTGEIGGPRGPEPTRYGDWEKAGRCSDF